MYNQCYDKTDLSTISQWECVLILILSFVSVTSMCFISNAVLLLTVLQSTNSRLVMDRSLGVHFVTLLRLSTTRYWFIAALDRRASRHLTSLSDTTTYAFFFVANQFARLILFILLQNFPCSFLLVQIASFSPLRVSRGKRNIGEFHGCWLRRGVETLMLLGTLKPYTHIKPHEIKYTF